MMMTNIQDILPDREIVKLKNEEFAGISYECWNISLPIFSDQVERLLEKGFMVSMLENDKVHVDRRLTPSPDKLRTNKVFWNNLEKALK